MRDTIITKFSSTAWGAGSITAIQGVSGLPLDEIIKLLIQLGVGIITIIKLLKKDKKEKKQEKK